MSAPPKSDYWEDDEEMKYLDTDPMVLEDPECQELMNEITALIPTNVKPTWDLNVDGWKLGLRVHNDRETSGQYIIITLHKYVSQSHSKIVKFFTCLYP